MMGLGYLQIFGYYLVGRSKQHVENERKRAES